MPCQTPSLHFAKRGMFFFCSPLATPLKPKAYDPHAYSTPMPIRSDIVFKHRHAFTSRAGAPALPAYSQTLPSPCLPPVDRRKTTGPWAFMKLGWRASFRAKTFKHPQNTPAILLSLPNYNVGTQLFDKSAFSAHRSCGSDMTARCSLNGELSGSGDISTVQPAMAISRHKLS